MAPKTVWIVDGAYAMKAALGMSSRAHQQLTRQWWKGRRSYRLFVSQIVRDEAAVSDPTARARRLWVLCGILALAVGEEATRLAGELIR